MTFRAVAVDGGIARTVDAGFAVQSLDFQACVVGKAVVAVFFSDILSLLQGIFLQRVVVFGNFLVAADVVQRQNFEFLAENLPNFLQFMLIIRRKNNFHHNLL